MKIKYSSRALAYAGVLIALNIILSRFVAIPIGTLFRISIGAVPIILAGVWLGPVYGGICGLLGDLIGCLVNGYAPNPLITVSAVLMGVIPALFISYFRKCRSMKQCIITFLLVLLPTFFVCSQGFTVLGLSLIYGIPFLSAFVSRLPQTFSLWAVDSILCAILYNRLKIEL